MTNPKLSIKTKFLNFIRLLFRNRLAESILQIITKNKSWKSPIAKIPANYYQYSQGSYRTVKRDNIIFKLDLSDYMQWLIYFGIEAEPRRTLYSLVKKGMNIIDIGANIGETTLNFSQITGPTGSVLSYEPVPETYMQLINNVELNSFENIKTFNIGIGNIPGIFKIEKSDNNLGGYSITDNNNINNNSTITINVDTLDNQINKLNIEKIDLIKIDVEGYEINVLKGATEVIDKFRPILFLEFSERHMEKQNSNGKLLIDFLHDRGYKLFRTDLNTYFKEYSFNIDNHFDVIAYP